MPCLTNLAHNLSHSMFIPLQMWPDQIVMVHVLLQEFETGRIEYAEPERAKCVFPGSECVVIIECKQKGERRAIGPTVLGRIDGATRSKGVWQAEQNEKRAGSEKDLGT